MKLLHVLATPREETSNTLKISHAFLTNLRQKYPALSVDMVDLFNQDLPAVAGDNIEAKYHLISGLKIDPRHRESWQEIESLIAHFLSADIYLISTPMWNFSIPYALKYYIDCIVQPGYLFRYDEQGQAIGMVANKKMICITSRGGDYSKESPYYRYDFQENYLRAIFGFCGIQDMTFVNAQPMDITPDIREQALQEAISHARHVADTFDFPPGLQDKATPA